MKNVKVVRVCLIALAAAGAVLSYASSLHIGDNAPQLKVDRWIKGTPVTSFEKGKVYVVEFWATWCGPCKVAMPHLSELAKKYAGQATFIGVDVWESEHSTPGENLKAKADKFVKEMGDRMGYNVCADTDSLFMTNNWLKAAGQQGIPATFVVGKDGKIDWIGHPYYLEDPLKQIIDGTFDVQAFASKENAQIEKERSAAAVYEKLSQPIEEAEKAKDYEGVLRACEDAIAKAGAGQSYAFAMQKYQILVKHYPDRALAEAKKNESDPAQHWMASEVFAATPGLSKDCYLFAMDFFQQKYKDQPQNPNGNAHYAMVYYQLGEPAKAAELFQVYVDAMKKENLDPVTMQGLEKELKKYKDAAAAAGK